MEAEKEILCQKYVRFQESKLNSDNEEIVIRALVTEWLKAYRDTSKQFEIHFYQIISNSFSREKSFSFNALQKAFEVFEKICVNLLIYPWRKEFKRIKTFAPVFVHYVWPAMCKVDIRQLLASIGYQEQEMEVYCYRGPDESQHLKKLAFEFLLAQLECERLAEMDSHGQTLGCNQLEMMKEIRSIEGTMDCLRVLEEKKNEQLVLKPIKMNWNRSRLEQNYEPNLRNQIKEKALTSGKFYKHDTFFLSNSVSPVIEEGCPLIHSHLTASVFPADAASEFHFGPSNDSWRKVTPSETKSVGNDALVQVKVKEGNLPAHQFYVEGNGLAENFLPCKCQICRASLGSLVCVRCGLAACTPCSTQPVISVPYHCEHEFHSFSQIF